MFKKDTVFVVGAGASREFKFPLGSELALRISDSLAWSTPADGLRAHLSDLQTDTLVKQKNSDPTEYYDAAQIIHRGVRHAASIDAYIDMHRTNGVIAQLGKLQIALQIARAEKSSALLVDDSNIYNRLDFSNPDVNSSWISQFSKLLLDGCSSTELDSIGDGVSVICFNYDRNIEQYLVYSISDAMAISLQDAWEVVNRLSIYHPYGSLGKLPQDPQDLRGDEVPYGAVRNPWGMAEALKTYSEELEEGDTLRRTRETVANARTIVFLGFSFAPQNMRLLQPESFPAGYRSRRFYSTGIGLHPMIHDEISRRMTPLAGTAASTSGTHIATDMACNELMLALAPMLSRPL